MKTDYAYCLNEYTCIHRHGCRRYLGNYPATEVKALVATGRDQYINDEDCIPNLSDVDCENDYGLLDRFRFSTGEEMK